MSRAIAVKFPTGRVLVGWGESLQAAASYAFKAHATPWCVQPERREIAELKVSILSEGEGMSDGRWVAVSDLLVWLRSDERPSSAGYQLEAHDFEFVAHLIEKDLEHGYLPTAEAKPKAQEGSGGVVGGGEDG